MKHRLPFRTLGAAFALWAAFAAWCVSGVPPCVDLPAHGAQLATLVSLLRGDQALAQLYEIHFPLGYGLTYWLALPLALLTDGALAIKALLFLALLIYPLSALALCRAFHRPDWYVLLALPLVFNISYWYGFLPGFFAQPMVFFAIAAFAAALEHGRRRDAALFLLAASAAMLAHLLAFVALALAVTVLAAAHARRRAALRLLALGLLPLLAAVPKIASMANRAVTPGDWPATEYGVAAHFNWFFRHYRPEGLLAAAGPLVVTAVLVALYLRRRRVEPLGPALAFAALAALYFVVPKTLSGIFLIAIRLPVLAGMLSLLLVGPEALARPLRVGLIALSLASLAETAVFHWRFARAVDGLAELMATPPPERHGYVSLVGRGVLGSKHVYLDHLGQGWTARYGKVGHNFFADAEHHPVQFCRGKSRPSDLWELRPEELAQFDELLAYGEVPLPAALEGWTEVQRVQAWRKLRRPGAGGD